MKVLPFKIIKSTAATLVVQEDRGAFFYNKLHQHEEIQISLILEGEGSLIVRDAITDYQAGDILIFDSHVPHVLKSIVSEKESHMISVFFTKDSFGASFFELPEFDDLANFFKNISYGVKVLSKKEDLKEQFLGIRDERNMLNRFVYFLNILRLLEKAKTRKVSSFTTKKIYTDNEGNRMATIFQLVMSEFHREITLKEISGAANMSPNAFCRYFKQRTNKTFFQFLTEIRIENACRLLAKNQEITIQEASYQSGFNNMSNFNKKFKQIKGITPSGHKKRMSGIMHNLGLTD